MYFKYERFQMMYFFHCAVCASTEEGTFTEFSYYGATERYFMKKQSVFGWQSSYCKLVTPTQDGKHSRCSRWSWPIQSWCYNRTTRDCGALAKEDHDDYRLTEAKAKLIKK